jgi:hypothetical protein
MKRKLFFLLFIFGVYTNTVYGQNSLAYQSKWQTRLLVGTNIPITKLLQGKETDYLFQYDDNSYYWQILSVAYFFYKHWGLEFNYQAGTSSRIRQRANHFTANMQSEYDDKYYVSPNTGGMYDDFNFFSGDIERGYLGIIYRFETNKFYVYPKFSIGVTSFYTDWGGAGLKEKNSNIECTVNYSSRKRSIDHFTLAPSVSFGYKIAKRFYLNADILFSHYKMNIVFEKKFTNLYTKESTMEYFDYKKNILTLSLGVGLIVVLH